VVLVKIIKLSNPRTINGKEYTKLELNFDNLTGRDLINAHKETTAMGDNSPVNEFSKTYLAAVAARAAKVKTDDILDLPARDFTNITIMVQNFLFGMDPVEPKV